MPSTHTLQLVFFGCPPCTEQQAIDTAEQLGNPSRIFLAARDEHSNVAQKWMRDPSSLNIQGRLSIDLVEPPAPQLMDALHQQTGCAVYLSRVHSPIPTSLDVGQRCDGTLQWCGFQKLEDLSTERFLDLWLREHTAIAIACQRTDSYAQHEILWHRGPVLDGIAEETFPIEAAQSEAIFFNAEDNPDLVRQHAAALVTSSKAFINFNTMCVAHLTERRLR